MACIIKSPEVNSKGVVVFTTQERDKFILRDELIRKLIKDIKNRWIVGLHHNWHDYKFKYNPLFDFHMAGEEDLIEATGKPIPLIPLDACNFSPKCFKPSANEKFWDILYVARAVYFKKIPEFFQIIRNLYDIGLIYRVLLICPVPPHDKSDKGIIYNVRDIYDKMFTEDEKEYFTLLTLDYRYPFPFNLETLSHFYKSSKIFVHSADDERRCRVTAYAWATGLPVVAMPCVGSLLPKELRKEPYFFEVKKYEDFPDAAVKAIEAAEKTYDFNEVWKIVSEDQTKQTLKQVLNRYTKIEENSNAFALDNLDIRLGRHHGLASGNNKINQSLVNLCRYLNERPMELIKSDLSNSDPEMFIAGIPKFDGDVYRIKKDNIYDFSKKIFRYLESQFRKYN